MSCFLAWSCNRLIWLVVVWTWSLASVSVFLCSILLNGSLRLYPILSHQNRCFFILFALEIGMSQCLYIHTWHWLVNGIKVIHLIKLTLPTSHQWSGSFQILRCHGMKKKKSNSQVWTRNAALMLCWMRTWLRYMYSASQKSSNLTREYALVARVRQRASGNLFRRVVYVKAHAKKATSLPPLVRYTRYRSLARSLAR